MTVLFLEGERVVGLDIGIGANGIYPIIGNHAYGWSFVGTDIDEKALQNCKNIIANNPQLIECHQFTIADRTSVLYLKILCYPKTNLPFYHL